MVKLVVFINGDRGLNVVQKLMESGFCEIFVVFLLGSPQAKQIEEICKSNKLPFICTTKPNKDERLTNLAVDFGVIAGFPVRLVSAVLNTPRKGMFNLHAGKLPYYRGGSPINWQIINDEDYVVCSVIVASENFDEGDIVAEKKIEITDDKTVADLHKESNVAFSELTVETLKQAIAGTLLATKQSTDGVAYWHQRNESDGEIDWAMLTSREVFNLVRALTKPYPGAYCYLGSEVIKIWSVELVSSNIMGCPGRVVNIQGDGPFVICKDKAVRLVDYTSEAQLKLKTGDRLG